MNLKDLQGNSSAFNYNPHPVDMSNLTLGREMQNMAERLAENAHDIWSKKKNEELNTCGGLFLHKNFSLKKKIKINFFV